VYCHSCDYNLAGLAAGRCPECARAFDPADPATYALFPQRSTRRRRWAAGASSALVLGAVAWLGFHVASPPAPVLLFLTLWVGLLGLMGLVLGIRPRAKAASRSLIVLALLPGFIMAGLFYSLALHMHRHLGGWPAALGTGGLPPSLETHAQLAVGTFGLLFLVNALGLPLMFATCAAVPRWRGGLFILGAYAMSSCLSFGVMLLAPPTVPVLVVGLKAVHQWVARYPHSCRPTPRRTVAISGRGLGGGLDRSGCVAPLTPRLPFSPPTVSQALHPPSPTGEFAPNIATRL